MHNPHGLQASSKRWTNLDLSSVMLDLQPLMLSQTQFKVSTGLTPFAVVRVETLIQFWG